MRTVKRRSTMNFASQLDFSTRMIPLPKQHALAWRMCRDTPWAHSHCGPNAVTGAQRGLEPLAHSPREIPARPVIAWPLPDREPRSRVCG
jgi:hypothetical protein